MMIIIGIVLVFAGIVFYSVANRNDVTNKLLCMLGFLTMIVGVLMIGMTMNGIM